MENVGCVTFHEDMIFKDEVGETKRCERALTILHELAHMWFGNLVTMEWWDDLWLNESFADFINYVALEEINKKIKKPFCNPWIEFHHRKQ